MTRVSRLRMAELAETVAEVGADLDGKVVIDGTNNIGGELVE